MENRKLSLPKKPELKMPLGMYFIMAGIVSFIGCGILGQVAMVYDPDQEYTNLTEEKRQQLVAMDEFGAHLFYKGIPISFGIFIIGALLLLKENNESSDKEKTK